MAARMGKLKSSSNQNRLNCGLIPFLRALGTKLLNCAMQAAQLTSLGRKGPRECSNVMGKLSSLAPPKTPLWRKAGSDYEVVLHG